MLFSSMLFLWIFLPITIIGNYVLKKELRNYFLLIMSLIFYAWGEPIYILLMIFSIVLNWSCGLLLYYKPKIKKLTLALCIILNLVTLGYFKYYNFFTDNINALLNHEVLPIKNIALPIGISFFTFQALSYVIDLYRGDCKIQKNLFNLALYITFFPQLIAGPIVRYSDIDNQIQNRILSLDKFAKGLRRFIYGLGKKVIISNCLAEVADAIFAFDNSELSFVAAWIGAIAYTFQIYYDFSGYSDMAIGLGHIFGFDFLENFNYPYLSRSIQEFWQKWHISLGTWFREYLYIPLGGNRKGKIRTYINLLVVFFATGMWHGANWTFIVWGMYHGFFQIIERLGFKKFLNKHKIFSHIYCILVFVFGWVMFRADTISQGLGFIKQMLNPIINMNSNSSSLLTIMNTRAWIVLVMAVFGCGIIKTIADKFPSLTKHLKNSLLEVIYLSVVMIYSIILLASNTYNPFIYFRF